eukprot:1930807-Karenia_brevis.AAC.1
MDGGRTFMFVHPNTFCWSNQFAVAIWLVVGDNRQQTTDNRQQTTNISCHKTKTIAEFSIGAMNVWMARDGTWAHKWRCFECQHPSCKQ